MSKARVLNAFWRAAARKGLERAVGAMSRVATWVGLDVVRRDFYSPIPDLSRLPGRHFTIPHPMPGIIMDLDAQLAFLESMREHVAEFPYPRRASAGFYLDNDSYEG